jgi:hypothetical protein
MQPGVAAHTTAAHSAEPPMAAADLAVTLPDIEAEALATVLASLGPEQFESAYQH